MIRATYENRALGQCCTLEFPARPGEVFEDQLQRVCTAVRDGLRIPPAPPTDPKRWAAIVATTTGKPRP